MENQNDQGSNIAALTAATARNSENQNDNDGVYTKPIKLCGGGTCEHHFFIN